MRKKRMLSLLVCGMLLFNLTACKNGENSSSATGSMTANTTQQTITFWYALSGTNGKAVQKLVDEYNNGQGKKDKVTVNAVFQGSYSDAMTKFKAAAQTNQSKNLPDIVQVPSDSTGYIKDLKSTIWAEDLFKRDNNLKKSNFIQNSEVQFSFKNKEIGIPFASSTILFYYNKSAFQEVGLDANTPPKTIEEMGQDAAKLYKTDGNKIVRYGLECEAGWYQLTSWIGMQSSGGNQYSFIGNNKSGRSNTMTKVSFDSDGTMKKFMDVYVPAMQNSHSKFTTSTDYNDFIAGTSAMYIGSSASISGITSGVGTKFSWGTAFLPKVSANDKGGAAPGGSALYVMNRGSDVGVNSACKFLEFLTSAQTQLDWCKNTGYFPINTKTYDLPEFKTYLSTNPYFNVAVNQIKSSNLYVQEPICGVSSAIGTAIDSNTANAIQGKIDTATAVANMVSTSNKALDDYNRENS